MYTNTNYQQQPAYGQVVGGQPIYGNAGGNANYNNNYPQHQQQQYYQQQQQYQQYQQQQQQAYYNNNSNNSNNGSGVKQQPQGAYANYVNGHAADAAPLMANSSPCEPYIAQGVPLYAEFKECGDGGSGATGGNYTNHSGSVGAGGKKFVVQGWEDVWAAVFFLLFSVAIIGVGCYNFKNKIHFNTSSDPINNDANWGDFHPSEYFKWGGIGVGAGFVLGVLSLGFFYCAPRVSILGANILICFIFFGMAGLLGYFGQIYGACVMGLVGLLRFFILYSFRKFIPMSSLFLKQSSIMAKRHPMAIVFAFVTLILAVGWCCFAFATAFPTIKDAWENDSNNNNNNSNNNNHHISWGPVLGMFFFLAFATYWSTQVAFNLGHTTFCGLTATWYFCGQETMPSNPTLHSAKRAMTTSFGSIVVGSLLVAIIRTIRYIIRAAAGNGNGGFCACIALCFLSCLEGIVRMFNHYAYVYVAMYGCSFVEGARKTMALIKESRYQPLFNNLLIDGTLMMFQLVLSCAVGLAAYYITRKQQLDDPANAGYSATSSHIVSNSVVFAVIAGVSCLVVIAQMFRVVDSTVTTLLVCLSEEPQLIFQTNPNFAGELAEQTNMAEVESSAAVRRDDETTRSMASV